MTPLRLYAFAMAALGMRPVPAPVERPPVIAYLRSLGASDDQIRELSHGTPFVRLLPSQQDRDVFVLGAVPLQTSPASYLTHALQPGRLIAGGAVRAHIIGSPVTSTDLSDLGFDESEYRSARDCRVDHCKFKMPLAMMQALTDKVEWSGPDARSQADDLLRHFVLQTIDGYRAHGNSALPIYDDTRSVHASDAFAALLAQSTDTYGVSAELLRYLADTPAARPSHTRDIMYWSEDRLPRLRPTLTLNHVVVYTPESGPAVIARKMLYANHYFESALELSVIVPGDAADANTYLVTVRRLRFDNLPRSLFNIRGRVTTKLVELTRSDLERERRESLASHP